MPASAQQTRRFGGAQTIMLALAVVAVFAVVAMIWYGASRPPLEIRTVEPAAPGGTADPDPRFVGSQACAGCHAREHAA